MKKKIDTLYIRAALSCVLIYLYVVSILGIIEYLNNSSDIMFSIMIAFIMSLSYLGIVVITTLLTLHID